MSPVALDGVRGCARKSHGRGLWLERQGQLPLGAPWFGEALGFVWGRAEISAGGEAHLLLITASA